MARLAAGAINENKPVSSNGPYAFAALLAPGANYTVSIITQPTGQQCAVSNATGTVGSGDVDNADVACGSGPGLVWDQDVWDQSWQ